MKELKQFISMGSSIEVVVEALHKAAKETPTEIFYYEFNGKILLSNESMDDAYLKVTGRTKEQFDAKWKADEEEYEREKKEHNDAIPRLTQEWIEKGRTFLEEKYWNLWDKVVPIRLADLYRGFELKATQEIIEVLNKSKNLNEVFDDAKQIFEAQNHSGMSAHLMFSMVTAFHHNGKEFSDRMRM